MLFLKRHWIAEIFPAVRDPATVKTDIFRIFCKLFDFLEEILTGQNTEMAFVFSLACFLCHAFPPIFFYK